MIKVKLLWSRWQKKIQLCTNGKRNLCHLGNDGKHMVMDLETGLKRLYILFNYSTTCLFQGVVSDMCLCEGAVEITMNQSDMFLQWLQLNVHWPLVSNWQKWKCEFTDTDMQSQSWGGKIQSAASWEPHVIQTINTCYSYKCGFLQEVTSWS